MANEIGTASNFEDLFTKIITFLTTNAALVTASQQWQVLRSRRDNVLGITTNLVEPTPVVERKIIHSFRHDARSLNTNNPGDSTSSYTVCTGYAAGASFISMQLRASKAVASVSIKAQNGSTNLPSILQNFRLQYSDDGSTWTTALTVSSNPAYNINELKSFAVPGTPGSHVYWRILIDGVQGGSTSGLVVWQSLLLLDSGGEIVNHFGSEVIFKATGAAGTDEIFTGIRSEYDAGNGWYNLFLNGYSGYDANEVSWFKQPGAIPGYNSGQAMMVPMVPCWNSTMPYWFSASGRVFKFVVKVSTSYESGYMGFILPYATPAQYTYPLAIGGSLIPTDNARGTEWRYSYNSSLHSCFAIPASDTAPYSETENVSTTLYLRTPGATWASFGQRYSPGGSSPNALTEMSQNMAPPYARTGLRRGVWPTSVRNTTNRRDYRDVMGGGYLLQATILHQRWPNDAVFGELDGIFAISGFSNASENTTVVGGKTNLVFQNISRTEIHEYLTLELS